MINHSFLIDKTQHILEFFPENRRSFILSLFLLFPNLIIYVLIKYSKVTKNRHFEKISSIGIFLAIGILMGDLYVHILPDTINKITKNSHEHE